MVERTVLEFAEMIRRTGDWALSVTPAPANPGGIGPGRSACGRRCEGGYRRYVLLVFKVSANILDAGVICASRSPAPPQAEIGRASCRERVCLYVVISVVAVY